MNGAVILSMIHTYLFVNRANNNLDVSENGVFYSLTFPKRGGMLFILSFFFCQLTLSRLFHLFFFSGS